MMRLLPLLCATALLAPFARADKFWLSDPAAETVEGSQAAVIEGVLLDETDTAYHLRTVGGELWLAKALVFEREMDGLTVAAIEETEEAERKRLAALTARLAQDRAAERRQRSVRAAEASVSRREVAVQEAAASTRREPTAVRVFDPVLGVAGDDFFSHQERLRTLELAYKQTKDRRYLVELRRLRRLH
jgi:hypothetical protein